MIHALGRRCLQFTHGSGVRGGPNCGIRQRSDLSGVYADPWNVGYYDVETSGRDAHFWYRMAQHYKNPEYLWAAEQVALGGRPPNGQVPRQYQAAYNKRFAWFVERGIEPRVPKMHAKVGLLSELKNKIKERIYLNDGVEAGKPYAAFFLYDKKDSHLDNVDFFTSTRTTEQSFSTHRGSTTTSIPEPISAGAAAGTKVWTHCWWFTSGTSSPCIPIEKAMSATTGGCTWPSICRAVSYTHLTLPTICSV